MRLPPLRERREDLGLIVASLLRRASTDARRVRLSRQAARALFRYPFRHNIRELEKALGLALTIARPAADGTLEITLDGFPEELRAVELRAAAPAASADTGPAPIQSAGISAPTGTAAMQYTHSGQRYLLGYGSDFFGIWDRNQLSEPIRRYPRTDDGWRQAWSEFVAWEPNSVEVGIGG